MTGIKTTKLSPTPGFFSVLSLVLALLLFTLSACLVEPPIDPTQTPADFIIGPLTQGRNPSGYEVTITWKNVMPVAGIVVYYNGSTEKPVDNGTYAVSFDVPRSAYFEAASSLNAGTLTIVNPLYRNDHRDRRCKYKPGGTGRAYIGWGDGTSKEITFGSGVNPYTPDTPLAAGVKTIRVTALNGSFIEELHCPNLGLSSLDLGMNPSLTKLYCVDNKLARLDLRGNLPHSSGALDVLRACSAKPGRSPAFHRNNARTENPLSP